MDFSGRVALVTGAAQGIGFAIADRLSREGAAVALLDVDIAGLEQAGAALAARGRTVRPLPADVTVRAEVEGAGTQTLERFGHLDVLVNNAGIAGQWMPLWELTDEVWHRVHAVNLTGAFYVTRGVIGHRRTRRYGRIVNVASVRRQGRQPERHPLFCEQGRSHRLDEGPGQRGGHRGHPGELRHAGRDRDGDPEAGSP